MTVLRGIRALRSDGAVYDEHSNLTDAGFTSVEMVKVMLGVETAFDLMDAAGHDHAGKRQHALGNRQQ